jgi:hypothetical protein
VPPNRCCIGLSLGVLLAAAPAEAQHLQGSRGHYSVSITVPVTAAKAWQVLTRYEAMAGLMPDIQQAKVLRRNGAELELAHTYQAPYTFGLPIRATLRLQERAPQSISYTLIRGERIRSLSGSWSITPIPGGVTVEHRIAVEPDLPGWMRPTYDALSEANLRESMRVLKRLMLTP